MDFPKYLDVIIGLAVVMVLLGPLVTAVTHVVLAAIHLARELFDTLHQCVVPYPHSVDDKQSPNHSSC